MNKITSMLAANGPINLLFDIIVFVIYSGWLECHFENKMKKTINSLIKILFQIDKYKV